MRVGIDLSRCAGYGNCIEAAPDVFDMSDDADVAVKGRQGLPRRSGDRR
jgi:ferredoxin